LRKSAEGEEEGGREGGRGREGEGGREREGGGEGGREGWVDGPGQIGKEETQHRREGGREGGRGIAVPMSGGGVRTTKLAGQNLSQTTTSNCITAIMHQAGAEGGREGGREGRREGR